MKVLIKHIKCGGFGSIIDCDSPRIFCSFCKERNTSFSEIKEITPKELYNLINSFNKIIISIYE